MQYAINIIKNLHNLCKTMHVSNNTNTKTNTKTAKF